jgi:endonuclease-3
MDRREASSAMRETEEQRNARARRIIGGLRRLYPDAECALTHANPLQLLVATILSAQCTDERVNQVTPALFKEYSDARAYAAADSTALETRIKSTGFFRNKTRSLIALGQALTERHGGEVPDNMEDLVELPGVGRKTANVILGTWFGQPAITVDTHVTRLTHRLGLSPHKDPVKIELDLEALFPENDRTFASHALIWHGRRVCKARKPACPDCGLSRDCPFPSN